MNLIYQIIDGIGYCQIGQIQRVINSVGGDLNMGEFVEIPLNTRISMRYNELNKKFLKKHGTDDDKYLKDMHDGLKEYLIELKLPQDVMDVWLEPLL